METTKIPLSSCIESKHQNRVGLGDVTGLAAASSERTDRRRSSWWPTAKPTNSSQDTAEPLP